MSIHSSGTSAIIGGPPDASDQRPARVLVLFEPTRSGVAALRDAAALVDGELTVVTLAPQSLPPRCCARGPGVEVVNCVIREEAAGELQEAREILGPDATQVSFRTLVGTHDPPADVWAAEQSFDLIVLPSRRLALGGHPLARRMRRTTGAEVRVVG